MIKNLCITATFFMVTNVAIAESAKGEGFEQAKSMALQMMDRRLADLQSAKDCISKATNHDQVKACRTEAQSERREMRSEAKEMREQFKKDRQQRR